MDTSAPQCYWPGAMLLASAALQASESPINIDADSTMFVVLALFVAFTLVLKPLLFDPMLKLFEERERWTIGKRASARELDDRAAKTLASDERELAVERAAAQAEREKIRLEAAKREQEILARARAASMEALENGKRAVKEEADRARAALRADVAKIGSELGARVLGRAVQS